MSEEKTVYLGLLAREPVEDGSALEVQGGGYGRCPVTICGEAGRLDLFELIPMEGITFAPATADWGTIVAVGVYDAIRGGELRQHYGLSLPQTSSVGESMFIGIRLFSHVSRRLCYCREDETPSEHRRKYGILPGYCGTCQICEKPGHACHFPGNLPYTGSWCDEHFELIARLMEEALTHDEPYGLRDIDRRCFRLDGQKKRRWLFFSFWEDTFYLEYRSQWLARYLGVNRRGTRWQIHQRWDHPLVAWLDPLEVQHNPRWVEISSEEFEQQWAEAIKAGSTKKT